MYLEQFFFFGKTIKSTVDEVKTLWAQSPVLLIVLKNHILKEFQIYFA